jgi:hypothetical protein
MLATLETDAAAALSEYTRVVLNDKKDEWPGIFWDLIMRPWISL